MSHLLHRSLFPHTICPRTVRTIPVAGSTGATVDLMSVATGGSKAKAPAPVAAAGPGGPYLAPGMRSLFMQVSLVFLLISGYYAMVRSLFCMIGSWLHFCRCVGRGHLRSG